VAARRLGSYEVLREIGRGGQATVYLAEDSRLGRQVALKVLDPGVAPDPSALERFRREAEITSRLDHPGICTVYETGEERGAVWIAMRYVEGDSLAKKIAAARVGSGSGESTFVVVPRTADQEVRPAPAAGEPPTGPGTWTEISGVLALFENAARALHVAHEHGVIHRDVKPGNLMVAADGHPVILDFGLAQDIERGLPALTQSGSLLGTPAYMSPEQLTPRTSLDRRTDVYSLGVSLYECLTLTRPFEAPTREGLYQAILTQEPRDPSEINAALTRDLRVVIQTAIEKNRDRRYQTALDLAEELRRVREHRSILARPVGPLTRAARWTQRNPALASVTIGLFLALGIGLVLFVALYAKEKEDRARDEARRIADEDSRRHEQVEGLVEQGYLQLEDRPARALETLGRALDLSPQSLEAVTGTVLALLNLERPDAARAALDARPSGQASPTFGRLRAEILRHEGKKSEAEALLAGLPAPATPLDHFLAGFAAIQVGHAGDRKAFETARHHLTQATLSGSGKPLYFFELAHAIGHLHDAKAARTISATLTARFAESPTAWNWAGFALSDVDPEAALAAYDRALRLHGAKPTPWADSSAMAEAFSRIAGIHLARGELDQAIASYRTLIRLVPDSTIGYTGLASALAGSGDQDAAIKTLSDAIVEWPRTAVLHARLGEQFFDAGRRKESIKAFERALELQPKLPYTWAALTFTLIVELRFKDALEAAGKGVAANPLDALAHLALASACVANGEHARGMASLKKTFELDPTLVQQYPDPHRTVRSLLPALLVSTLLMPKLKQLSEVDPAYAVPHILLGIGYRASGNLKAAVEKLKLATDLDPKLGWAHFSLGSALIEAKDWQGAVNALRRATEVDAEYEWAWFYLGDAHLGLGDRRGAIQDYQRALEIDPGLERAWLSLARALREEGDLARARESIVSLLRRRPGFEAARNELDAIEDAESR
jgi:serine/threonine protein kinase/predicted Zn-dependent protease